MKYLCLIYFDEKALETMSASDFAGMEAECVEYEKGLKRGRQLLAVEALQSVQAATTVRVRNGRSSVIDGPFAETKEQLGGFYLIEATDLNDAIRVASRIPPARLGGVEVRPVRQPGDGVHRSAFE